MADLDSVANELGNKAGFEVDDCRRPLMCRESAILGFYGLSKDKQTYEIAHLHFKVRQLETIVTMLVDRLANSAFKPID